MLGIKCDLKMYVRNLEYPLPLQMGGPKTIFDDFVEGVSYVLPKRHEL